MDEQQYLVVTIECFECAEDLDEAVTPLGVRSASDLKRFTDERGFEWEEVNGYKRSADRQGGVWAFPLPS